MSVQLQDRYNDPMMSTSPATLGDEFGPAPFSNALAPAFVPLPGGLDSISRFFNPQRPQFGNDVLPGTGLMSLIQQLLSAIGSLLGNAGASTFGGGQYFANASGGSTGDPHLSFNGNTWNDMQGESDLLDSDSIRGGYRLSTQTTQPNANGVTYNARATVTTGYGNTQVTLDKDGNATYTRYGVTNALEPGESVDLGDGQTVARNQNGSLTIANATPSGGRITTTMSENGHGVDVNVSASNVDLGGTLVNAGPGSATAPSRPVYQRY